MAFKCSLGGLTTGYGCQTRIFLPRLKELGHEMSMTAFYGLSGSIIEQNGIRIYPKAFHPYGQDIVAANAGVEKADILISLVDAWVCNPRHMSLNGNRWVPWFPIDSEPIAPSIVTSISEAYKRIVFSHHAENMLDAVGLDYYYVPHGIDTNIFKPYDKAESRKMLGIPEDAYLVGMVAANKGNPSRKAFAEQIAAFLGLKNKHPEAVLYLHTHNGENGQNQSVNLPEFLAGLELVLNKDVFFCNQHQYQLAFSDDYMARAYSAMDVLMNVSYGEGFGIPIIEAQACGTPVIVGDWTSMGELCFSGRKVAKSDAHPFYTSLASYQFIPRIEAITSLLIEEYKHPSNREAARGGAMAYDADLVVKNYWKPVLEDIAENLPKGETNMKLVKF